MASHLMVDFEGAVGRVYPELFRFAMALTRSADLAGDLTHDTVVRGLSRLDTFTGDERALGAWMRTILHNLAIDRHRRDGRELSVEEVELWWREDEYTVDPVDFALQLESREELEDALTRLPFIYRVMVILHDAEGWTVKEIADLQQIGLPAAKQRLRRGRMALVSALAGAAERKVALDGVPMRCWDARRHVSDLLDGVLDVKTSKMVHRHLETCPTCPPLYASLVSTTETLGAMRDPDSVIPPEVVERINSILQG